MPYVWLRLFRLAASGLFSPSVVSCFGNHATSWGLAASGFFSPSVLSHVGVMPCRGQLGARMACFACIVAVT